MTRPPRRALLSLIGGLAVTLAVAWTCAYLFPLDYIRSDLPRLESRILLPSHRQRTELGDALFSAWGTRVATTHSVGAWWLMRDPEDWLWSTYPYPEDVHPQLRARFGDPPYTPPRWGVRHTARDTAPSIVTFAYGWPFRALCGVRKEYPFYTPEGELAGIREEFHWFWRRPLLGRPWTKFPLRPIWGGLAANTALYAAAIWAVAATPSLTNRAVRTLRRRRGACPLCAYDLNHDLAAGCPECGWNRPPRAPVATPLTRPRP